MTGHRDLINVRSRVRKVTQLQAERAMSVSTGRLWVRHAIDLDPTVLSSGLAGLNQIRDVANVRTASWRRAARASLRSSGRVATVRYSASRFLELSTMQTSLATTGQRAVIWGDWSGFTIVDRLGAQIELMLHRFGATNRFSQGQRKILYIWPSSSGVTKPHALRLILLRIAS